MNEHDTITAQERLAWLEDDGTVAGTLAALEYVLPLMPDWLPKSPEPDSAVLTLPENKNVTIEPQVSRTAMFETDSNPVCEVTIITHTGERLTWPLPTSYKPKVCRVWPAYILKPV